MIDGFHKFHVVVFFFLAGYLYRKKDYVDHIKRKALRTMTPYAMLAVVGLLLKSTSGLYVQLENPVARQSLLNIIIYPLESYVPLLWFLYALFIIFALYPPLEFVLKNRMLVFVATLLLALPSYPNMFCLSMVFRYLPFFALGAAWWAEPVLTKEWMLVHSSVSRLRQRRRSSLSFRYTVRGRW